MTDIELKKRLKQKINQIENNLLLEDMYRMAMNEETGNSIYEVSSEQRLAIEEANEQYKNGLFLKGEVADKEIDQWLGK